MENTQIKVVIIYVEFLTVFAVTRDFYLPDHVADKKLCDQKC